jgi:hypothetical protein
VRRASWIDGWLGPKTTGAGGLVRTHPVSTALPMIKTNAALKRRFGRRGRASMNVARSLKALLEDYP